MCFYIPVSVSHYVITTLLQYRLVLAYFWYLFTPCLFALMINNTFWQSTLYFRIHKVGFGFQALFQQQEEVQGRYALLLPGYSLQFVRRQARQHHVLLMLCEAHQRGLDKGAESKVHEGRNCRLHYWLGERV